MFGAQYPATKIAVTNMSPLLLSLLTFILGGMTMVPFLILETRAHPGQPRALALLGKGNLFPFFMSTILGYFPGSVVLAWGIDHSLASNGALLTLTIPIFSAVLAAAVRDERMTRWRWFSFVLGITGAMICSERDWRGFDILKGTYLLGNTLILVGCWGSAFTNVYSKGLLERFRPVRLLVSSYVFTGLMCLLLLLCVKPSSLGGLTDFPLRTWAGLGVLGFFSWGLSMVIFFHVLSRLEVTQVSLSIYLLPFFGVLLSALILHDRITGSAIAGGLLVLIGTTIILFAENAGKN